jgi:endonuclease/exonuclease/phosphatase family metal-dependent hydrolase
VLDYAFSAVHLVLAGVPVLTLILLAVPGTHDLVRSYPPSAPTEELPILEPGPAFWAFFAYNNVLLLGATTLFVVSMVRLARSYRRMALALIAAGLAAAAARARAATNVRPAIDRQRMLQLCIGLAIVVLGAGLARGGDSPAPPQPNEPGEPIRLMLYNLHMGYDPQGRLSVPELARVIGEHDPDLVVLNEVDRGWLVTGGHDVLQLLLDELDELYPVFAPAADEVWGNALLSRFPVTELSTGRLPRGSDPMPRGQLAAIVEIAPDVQIGIVGTHLSHIEDQGATRLPQARSVAATVAWLRDRGLPTAVLGDLNAEPDSAEIQTFGTFVGPTLRANNPTWPSWDPQRQIDHILVSGDLTVVEAEVIDTQASDHLPILVTVTLEEP